MFKFKQGQIVKDVVTGFKGPVTVRTDDIIGRIQYFLACDVGEDGEFRKGHWFDEERLAIMDGEVSLPAA